MTDPRPRDVWRRHGQLTPPRPGDVLVTASIGPGGRAVALWAAPQEVAALRGRTADTTAPTRRRFGTFASTSRSVPKAAAARTRQAMADTAVRSSFPDVTLQEPAEVRVSIHGPAHAMRVITVPDLRLAHRLVQPMPDGELLVVGSRCAWTPDGVMPNAAVYSVDGSLRRTAVVGDGVQHLRSTPSGQVWIGYSDEGIYGNFGWGTPGPAPIGRSGLARFDRDLDVSWEFPAEGTTPRIDDCEALNVDHDVWTCYSSDFPLVRIDGDQVTTWPTGLDTVSAVLADQTRVALVGAQTTVAELNGDNLQVTSTQHLALPPDAEAAGSQLIGQGSILHALTPDGLWYVTDLDILAGDR
jgi:hypothetical protein